METTMIKEDMTFENAMPEKPKKIHKKRFPWGSQILLILALFFVIAPFYILIITSFMTKKQANDVNIVLWPIPWEFKWYSKALFEEVVAGSIPLLVAFGNTIWMYVPSTIVGILSSTLAAYAFAKLEFKLKNAMFAILMFTMMLPNTMSTLTSYYLYKTINWTQTPYPIMIPRLFGTIGVVFFLRQYFMGIPTDIMNAARIDGAGDWGVFFHIMLGVAKPAMFAQFILQFLSAYNDYMGPYIYLNGNPQVYTLQVALKFLLDADIYDPNPAFRMAGCLVAMLPLVVLYICAQKVIMRGIAMSAALKG